MKTFKKLGALMVRLGIDNLMAEPGNPLKGIPFGLLTNQGSLNSNYQSSLDILSRAFESNLKAIFTPQHGYYSEKQDNMIESQHDRDEERRIPVYSLYSETRCPTDEMLGPIDVLVIDLQDVGTRVYTFIYSIANCLRACKNNGVKVIVLDRPNPVNGVDTEGNLLAGTCQSFVGMYPIPMRHGLTVGEIAVFFNQHFSIGAELQVIWMTGWQREFYYHQTGLPWHFPSPNLPAVESCYVYPGQVIFEGTNLSEGRGTTKPFEFIGAPYIKIGEVQGQLDQAILAGTYLRPLRFEPTSGKHQSLCCQGFHIHLTDLKLYRPYRLALHLYQTFYRLYPGEFTYKQPPYEYEFDKLPMDIILGDLEIRKMLEAGRPIMDMENSWQADLESYNKLAQRFWHYQ